MKAQMKTVGNWSVVSLEGRIDTVSAPSLEQQLLSWTSDGVTRMIMDFSGVDYISSAGLRTVLATGKRLKSMQGKLLCCGLTGMVKRVFDVSGFAGILPLFESLDDALRQE